MTEEQLTLARRLVACEQWRWLPGMELFDRPRLIEDDYAGGLQPDTKGSLPDLSDYTTAAILLRMAIETGLVCIPSHPRNDHYYIGPPLAEGVHNWIDMEDLGTAAAKALLATWEPQCPTKTRLPSRA